MNTLLDPFEIAPSALRFPPPPAPSAPPKSSAPAPVPVPAPARVEELQPAPARLAPPVDSWSRVRWWCSED